MFNSFKFNIFKNLVKSELAVFKEVFWDKFIDLAIWVVLTLFVMGYIMPLLGLSADYGTFQLATLIASAGLFEVYPAVVNFVSDLEGDNAISYNLTLPIESSVALFAKVAYYSINSFILSILMLPIGKLVLFNSFSLVEISWFKFLLILLSTSFFYGTFTLWSASMVKDMTRVGSVWMRFIYPLWWLGGFNFSFTTLSKVSPNLAYLSLLNPIMYITEAFRAAIIGQADYLNFWLCLLAIIFFSLLCLIIGYLRLKKKLDFV